MRWKPVCAAALAYAAMTADLGAAGGEWDLQRDYSLFNPTPPEFLRDMTTDRPDTTESPFTVDAGHIQIETQAFGYARSADDPAGGHIDSYEFGTTNFRIGLTSALDLGVVVATYGIARGGGGFSLDDAGLGGIELRPKLNLWGNDKFGKASRTALALLPYVVVPTDSDNGISPEEPEFGLIVPLAVYLSERLALGLNATLESVLDGDGRGRHAESAATASFAYEWSNRLGTYHELVARFGGEDGAVLIAATGLTYALGENAQLDMGVNIGLTDTADRLAPFVGFSVRY